MFLIFIAVIAVLLGTMMLVGTVIGAIGTVVGFLFSGPVLIAALLGGGYFAGKKGVKQLTR